MTMSRRRRLRSTAVASLTASALVLMSAGAVRAGSPVHIVVAFDESAGQNTEGIAIDRTGDLFVSVSPLGDLWKIPAGTTQPQAFGHVDGIVPGRDFGMLGLAVDVFGNVYAAVQSADPAVDGVYRFDRVTGDATRLPGTDAIAIPNGLAFDKQANLYVTDSAAGAIWRIPWGGSAEVWLQDAELTGDGSLGLGVPLGANGIAYRNGVFTVTNTEHRTVLAIPKVRGSAGPVHQLTTLPEGDNPDGVTMDTAGDAFVAINLANAIGKVSSAGSLDIVASGDPLDFPSSVTFGSARGQRRTLYGVNFSLGELFGQPPGFGPAVFSVDVGVPGVPTP